MSEHMQSDLEVRRDFQLSSEVVDLLWFANTGEGSSRDIVRKMRIVIEAYCTATYPGFFDSGDTLMSIVAKIRGTGEQHPACALLDELDEIHAYSCDYESSDDDAEQLDPSKLRTFVLRTLKIVGAKPDQESEL